jgi:hypothetical protein
LPAAAVLVASVLVAAVALVLWTGGHIGDGQAAESPASVAVFDSVRSLDPNAGHLTADGPYDGEYGKFYLVSGTDVIASVSTIDGHVMVFDLTDHHPTSAVVSISKDEAQARAEAYLGHLGIATKGLQVTVELDGDVQSKWYLVTWQGHDGEITLPERVEASVNPVTGEVFSFTNQHRSYSPAPSPAISKDDAISAANRRVQIPGDVVRSANLRITFDPQARQMLVWDVVLEDGSGGGVALNEVLVDAVSGTTWVGNVPATAAP